MIAYESVLWTVSCLGPPEWEGVPTGALRRFGNFFVSDRTRSAFSSTLYRAQGRTYTRVVALGGGSRESRGLFDQASGQFWRGDRFSGSPSGREGIRWFRAGVDLVEVGCESAATNSTGESAVLSLISLPRIGDSLDVTASQLLPGGMTGYLIVGDQLGVPITPPGAAGPLCVGGQLGRLVGQVQAADAAGQMHFLVNSNALPLNGGPTAVEPGETWSFQLWHRDMLLGLPTSNFSRSLSVTFY